MKDNCLRRRQSGFTLIEIAVALAIIGILAAVALPAYQDQLRKSRRGDAKTELNDTAQRLRRCFTDSHTYTGCLTFPFASGEGHYQIGATLTDSDGNGTTDQFSLTAAPQDGQSDDAYCGSFSLSHLGVEGVSGTGGAGFCW